MTRRTGGAANTRKIRSHGNAIDQLPFKQVINPFTPLEIVSADELESIHQTSLRILKEIGINFLLPEAREIFRCVGADIDGERVRLDPELVEASIALAPPSFKIHARNPAHSLIFGDKYMNFGTIGGPPWVTDQDRGRRYGNYEDFCDLLRLGQSLNTAHLTSGYPVEPDDIAVPVRHLKATMAMIELTDKVFRIYASSRERILDQLTMVRIMWDMTEEEFENHPCVHTNVNANTPMQYDIPMTWGIIEMAKRNQPVGITPFTLAGAMAPVTIAGALAQQNAEALAGITLTQLVRPGAPVIYGGFTSNVNMKTGSPSFATPEFVKAAIITGQLTRRYKLPFRSSNTSTSNIPDAQSAYESQTSIWSSVLSGVNYLQHAHGWMEGSLCASYEKYILDAEMLQMITEVMKPVIVNSDELAFDAIREVGPGGHFFGVSHTMERYETAFYHPLLSDHRNFEPWAEDGAQDATTRANHIYKKLLSDYEQPPLNLAIQEALNTFVRKREDEGGAHVY